MKNAREYIFLEHTQRGVTLMDTLVGTALMLVIFLGIAAAFQLSVDVVTNNKARGSAIALANERMEYMRSVTYASLGTSGGIPSGSIAQSEAVVLNGITFTRRTLVAYADDPKDGTGASDTFPAGSPSTADYKVGKVDVAWTSRTGTRHIALVSRFEPPAGMEVACTPPCGTLTVNVFNAASAVLSGASVSIVNSGTSPAININTFTNESGVVSFIGAPAASGYQIVVSKTGYSTDQTYTTPPEQHITVSNNATAVRTSRIDVLGQKTIKTWTQILLAAWTDTFADSSKIASSATTTIAGGVAHLTGSSGTYPPTGDFQSISIAPSSLNKWKTFSAATSTPLATAVLFRFYDGTGTTLIPDSAIPGNSTGIATSTVSLLGVSTTTYPSMRVGTTLTSGDSSVTPSVDSYSVAYDYGPTPLPSLAFSMIGAKVISNGPPTVYKYNSALSSGAGASLALSNVEYDTYTIVVDAATTGYDVAAVCQPQSEYGAIGSPTTQFVFAPAAQTQTDIFLAAHTANSLLVDVRSAATGALVTNASVRLYKTGYDTTVTDGTCGQAFFGGLASGTYSVEVSASGYTTYTSSAVSVSETGRLSVTLD
ncbi:carboxypeptidase regulatory-like domain-containing protein [Candidatus Kaiserbacteria bacterium]|nr:carboxypeptidase regulatory-like domain-containing protein [Candidatus Kaiserbacteria bacterium]